MSDLSNLKANGLKLTVRFFVIVEFQIRKVFYSETTAVSAKRLADSKAFSHWNFAPY